MRTRYFKGNLLAVTLVILALFLASANVAWGSYSVEVLIRPEISSGEAGTYIEYKVTVRNTGTDDDTYDLVVTDTLGWAPTLDEVSLQIDAGEWDSTPLRVTIPLSAPSATEDTIAVTATSRTNPSVSSSAQCKATVGWQNKPTQPTYIYLTWASADTAHTMNVSWGSYYKYVGEVYYGTTSGSLGNYKQATDYGLTTPQLEGRYINHVELTGLDADTPYYFICGNSTYGWSDEQSFRTAPDVKRNFTFVAGGDSRDDARYIYTDWPSARDDITQQMALQDPEFAIFIGDFLWSSENPGQNYADEDTWHNWLGAWYQYARTSDGRLIPIVPVIGNHEIVYPYPDDYDPETQAKNYYTVFNLPRVYPDGSPEAKYNERWYSLSWGPGLKIIVLDGEVLDESSTTWQDQLTWLDGELSSSVSAGYDWIVVAFHRPFVTATPPPNIPPLPTDHPNYDERIDDWSKKFSEYGVDIVLTGHLHYYERTYPIYTDPALTWHYPDVGVQVPPGGGPYYVVSGGWGGPLGPHGITGKWFDEVAPDCKYHFTKIVITFSSQSTLRFKAIDRYGAVFDEFTLTAPAPAPVGGIAFQPDKLALLAPWIILAALIAIASVSVAVYWRRRH